MGFCRCHLIYAKQPIQDINNIMTSFFLALPSVMLYCLGYAFQDPATPLMEVSSLYIVMGHYAICSWFCCLHVM
jgi:uncharacterized membrane protein